jgi:hypothetical protein
MIQKFQSFVAMVGIGAFFLFFALFFFLGTGAGGSPSLALAFCFLAQSLHS